MIPDSSVSAADARTIQPSDDTMGSRRVARYGSMKTRNADVSKTSPKDSSTGRLGRSTPGFVRSGGPPSRTLNRLARSSAASRIQRATTT